MKDKDLRALLIRAAAAIETPADLTKDEINHVIEDLRSAAEPAPKGWDQIEATEYKPDLHNQIMNIQAHGTKVVESLRKGGATKSDSPPEKVMLAYRIGHRDARHEAAELAIGHEPKLSGWMDIMPTGKTPDEMEALIRKTFPNVHRSQKDDGSVVLTIEVENPKAPPFPSQGKCTRTVCNSQNAVCWHTDRKQFYCPACARAINENNRDHPDLVLFPIDPDDRSLMLSIEDFINGVCFDAFTDDDGFGYFATENHVGAVRMYPSEVAGIAPEKKVPAWATHVVWFNK
jgi:hypothetical protein